MELARLCVHQLFQQQAARTPDAIAVVDGDRSLTYSKLDQVTDSLAGYLQEHGVHFDQRVGVLMETCADYLIACLAALKAGGAYLPLDMAYPEALLSKILHEAQSQVVVTKSRYRDRLDPTLPATILAIDNDPAWQSSTYDEAAVAAIGLDHLAYVPYSSGTTGEPKGILAPHRGAVHSYGERYKLSSYQPGDRVACNIFFVWEVFRPLLKGATIYVIPDHMIYDPKLLTAFLAEHEITEVLFTPSLMETVLNSVDPDELRCNLSSLNVLWLNGEVVTMRLKHRALATLPDHVQIFNTYSISECHDVASLNLRQSPDLPSGICPVGYPIDGISIRLLDEHMQPVPANGVGELYIGGSCLARGYLNKPELTAERFVELGDKRFYRTGDLAFIHPDGNLEIRGRCDFMVKIRGYSIHLGAVETALLEYAKVKSCAVIAEGEEGEDKRLVAYVVRSDDADWNISPSTGACTAVRQRLKPYLADYMIPSVYVELDAIPLNPTTGKLNRKLLPSPPRRDDYDIDDIQLTDTASEAEQREAMRTVWERILSLEEGGIQDDSDFFDFGGHSLLAVRLTNAIETIFNAQVMVKEIYEHPTVTALMHHLNHRTETTEQSLSIREDARLPAEIIPAPQTKPLSLNQASTIFLTGATGFLGAFLLDELLRTMGDHTKIYCLTRIKGGDEDHARQRIINNLETYDLRHDYDKDRIVPVVGDLAQPNLGLSHSQFDQLSREVDFILHCAALVNYAYPYTALKPHTVDGTREILRLAAAQVRKPVYYLSTNGIFPAGQKQIYKENQDIDAFAEQLEVGYDQAKWVAEKLVWDAVSRGLPVCVFRPGNIGHHHLTGAVNPNDFQFHIISACLKVGCAPDTTTWAFEMTPVDFLVQSIVQFATDPCHFGNAYHVVQSNPLSARTIFDFLMEQNYISQYVAMATWMSILQSKAEEHNDYILSVLAQSLGDVESYLTDRSVYDSSRFNRSAEAYGIKTPLMNLNYFERFIQRHLSTQSYR